MQEIDMNAIPLDNRDLNAINHQLVTAQFKFQTFRPLNVQDLIFTKLLSGSLGSAELRRPKVF